MSEEQGWRKGVYELVVGKQGKKEYPHLDKKTHQPERRLTNGNE